MHTIEDVESVIRINNTSYCLVSDDHYLASQGADFEPYMVDLLRMLVSPEDRVFDIGGNIGLTAILLSSLAKQVATFEPSASTYRLLVENIRRSGVHNVQTVNMGFGNVVEEKTIAFFNFPHSCRAHAYVPYEQDVIEAERLVENIHVDTLDHYIAQPHIYIPTFLKIDVEGFEKHVIEGGLQFIKEYRPTVVLELNHYCLNVLQRITIPDFFDFLRSVFPIVCAVDISNTVVLDLHNPKLAFYGMHEHVVNFRFPNIVASFDERVIGKLVQLCLANTV